MQKFLFSVCNRTVSTAKQVKEKKRWLDNKFSSCWHHRKFASHFSFSYTQKRLINYYGCFEVWFMPFCQHSDVYNLCKRDEAKNENQHPKLDKWSQTDEKVPMMEKAWALDTQTKLKMNKVLANAVAVMRHDWGKTFINPSFAYVCFSDDP